MANTYIYYVWKRCTRFPHCCLCGPVIQVLSDGFMGYRDCLHNRHSCMLSDRIVTHKASPLIGSNQQVPFSPNVCWYTRFLYKCGLVHKFCTNVFLYTSTVQVCSRKQVLYECVLVHKFSTNVTTNTLYTATPTPPHTTSSVQVCSHIQVLYKCVLIHKFHTSVFSYASTLQVCSRTQVLYKCVLVRKYCTSVFLYYAAFAIQHEEVLAWTGVCTDIAKGKDLQLLSSSVTSQIPFM